ncbi:hypothetical protein ACN27F_15615 [Solwaraspora sp. WMMB335]|uniref:Rv0361 family membrane protein n=1 Tax=Solwaraspora sp. WMMB335 TaxID=3404118 RepID=UPI003B951DD7
MEQTRPAIPVRRLRVPRQRGAPGSATPPVVPPGRRLRLALVLITGTLALLCLGGAGVVFVLYANVTAPDRGTPGTAVRNYLIASLDDRDDVRAAAYTCAEPDLSAIQEVRERIVAYEERNNTVVVVRIHAVEVQSESPAAAVVTATVRQTATTGSGMFEIADQWRFQTVDQGGWRVCSAEQLD